MSISSNLSKKETQKPLIVVKKENGRTLFSKNILNKMKKKSTILDDRAPNESKVLADKNDATVELDQSMNDIKREEAVRLATLLPEAPNGKKRFVDYFVKMSNMQ